MIKKNEKLIAWEDKWNTQAPDKFNKEKKESIIKEAWKRYI